MITVYSKPACVQCTATYRKLDAMKLEYLIIDVTKSDKAMDHVKSLGYRQMPVVERGSTHFCGYQPGELQKLAEKEGAE